MATAKHFLGYGASDGGLNHGPVQLGSRELRDVFAEPFAAAIRDARLASVMNSYASVDGLPASGSRVLLTELLRDDLGFVGTVVADYFAVDLLRTTTGSRRPRAWRGRRRCWPASTWSCPTLDCFAALPDLIEAEIVPESVDRPAVRRVLRHKFELGLFDDPYVDEASRTSAFGTRRRDGSWPAGPRRLD